MNNGRCPRCDRPHPTAEMLDESKHAPPTWTSDGCTCEACLGACFAKEWGDAHCGPRVDWRERALAAEAEVATERAAKERAEAATKSAIEEMQGHLLRDSSTIERLTEDRLEAHRALTAAELASGGWQERAEKAKRHAQMLADVSVPAAMERAAKAEAEVARLTECLKRANANHEEYERRFYLATHRLEDAEAERVAAIALLQSVVSDVTRTPLAVRDRVDVSQREGTVIALSPNVPPAILDGSDLFCRHCGKRETVFPMSLTEKRIKALQLLAEAFSDEHAHCTENDRSPTRRAGESPDAWLNSGDTGISSMTIWSVMTGRPFPSPHFRPKVPLDPSDFAARAAIDLLRLTSIDGYNRRRNPVRFANLDDALDAFDAGDLLVDEWPATGTRPLVVTTPWGRRELWRGEVQRLARRRGAP